MFIFFNQTQDLRAPSADRLETLHSDQHIRHLFNASPKLGRSSLKIFTPAKFSVDFTHLPTLIANISGTRQDIKNRKDMWSRAIPLAFGELWSTIHKGVHVSLDPPKSIFSTEYISAPRGCWLLKFLHVQALVAHIVIGVGGPLKNFKGEHLKLGLKFHTWAPITLGVVGIPSRNLTRGRGSRPGWSSRH